MGKKIKFTLCVKNGGGNVEWSKRGQVGNIRLNLQFKEIYISLSPYTHTHTYTQMAITAEKSLPHMYQQPLN